MFIHQKTNLVIPHRFHAKFCGDLVSLRGNEIFGLPNVSKEDLIEGIADHDRGYDEYDNVDIIGLRDNAVQKDKERIKYFEKSLERVNDNVIANIISLRHVQSLAKDYKEYEANIIALIDAIKTQHNIETNFDQIQTITNFLDNIAFDCSYGIDRENSCDVYDFKEGKEIKITYTITGNTVAISPMPFHQQVFDLMLAGCQKTNYPQEIITEETLYHFQAA